MRLNTSLLIIAIVVFMGRFAWSQSDENVKALSYLSYVSSQIVQRPLNDNEVSLLRAQGSRAFGPIIEKWVQEPAFATSVQTFVDLLVRTSGNGSDIDYNLPGYLGKELAKKNRPYADLLTADTCYDANGSARSCDTQAPFTAGVLTTRAFLSSYKGAYNISRAGKIVKKFLCTDYPLPDSEEPKLLEADLIPQFATTSGAISFGNGNNCYSCHAQFGLHAQFFVKFGLNGVFQANASGLQDPGTSDGLSFNGTATSHLKAPARASSQSSRMLGKPANNLRDAAIVVTESPRFLPCATQNLMKHYLRMSDQTFMTIKPDLFKQIAEQAKKRNAKPSFSDLVIAILTNKHVYNSFKQSGAMP